MITFCVNCACDLVLPWLTFLPGAHGFARWNPRCQGRTAILGDITVFFYILPKLSSGKLLLLTQPRLFQDLQFGLFVLVPSLPKRLMLPTVPDFLTGPRIGLRILIYRSSTDLDPSMFSPMMLQSRIFGVTDMLYLVISKDVSYLK